MTDAVYGMNTIIDPVLTLSKYIPDALALATGPMVRESPILPGILVLDVVFKDDVTPVHDDPGLAKNSILDDPIPGVYGTSQTT
jgi:hypothetical protein